MKGGTTSPSWSALVGGWTDPDPRKQNSLAYSRGPQIIGEANPGLTVSSSFQPGPIQGIDGGRTPSSKRLLPPSTLLGPAGRREARERRYSCETCGQKFVQPQGVSRHRQRVHDNPHSCFVSGCKYNWTRPYEYRAHLEKQHPNDNPDKVLGKPRGSRRRSTIIGRDRPRFSPGIEPDEWSQAEPWQRPMAPHRPAVAKVINVPSPVMSLAYEAQPENAEPPVATRKHEDGRRLDFLGATNAPSALSSEACIQSVDDLAISIQGSQIRLPTATLGGSTAADSSTSAVTPLIHALTPPVGYDFVDRMVEPSLPIYPYPFPVADYSSCEIGTNKFVSY